MKFSLEKIAQTRFHWAYQFIYRCFL